MKRCFDKFCLFVPTLLQAATLLSHPTFKEEKFSSIRSQIILDGEWAFQTIAGSANELPGEWWGTIPAPGAWATEGLW